MLFRLQTVNITNHTRGKITCMWMKGTSWLSFVISKATRGDCNLNLQGALTYVWHVCSQHSFGLPLRMNGMQRTQPDHVRFDLLSRETCAKHQRWSKSFFGLLSEVCNSLVLTNILVITSLSFLNFCVFFNVRFFVFYLLQTQKEYFLFHLKSVIFYL